MAYDIFISYRRTDGSGLTSGTDIARTIKQQLEIEGYKNRVFFDYSELSDDEFEQVILTALEQCKVFILVLTKDSMMRCVNEGDWVRREISHAQKCGLKIIPVEPDNLFNGYPKDFPAELNVVKRVQHSKIHMDSSFERDMRAMIDMRIRPVLPKYDWRKPLKWIAVVACLLLAVWGGMEFMPWIQTRIKTLQEQRAEEQRIAAEADSIRVVREQIKADSVRTAQERVEAERIAAERAAAEQAVKEKAEQDAAVKAEAERKAAEKAKTERIAAEKAAKKKAEQDAAAKAEAERKAKEAATEKTYKVGDYYNDGTKEGVVFYVDATGKHGKIVSLQQSERLSWCTYKFNKLINIGATSHTDGKANTDKAMARDDSRKYTAFVWCRNMGRDWYLPAIEELELLLLNDSVYNAVNKTLESRGAMKLLSRQVAWDSPVYWSSTEQDNNYYVVCIDGAGCCKGDDMYYGYAKGGYGCVVRAVAQF